MYPYDDEGTAQFLEPLPTQSHTCTAIIEDLVAKTPDSAWDEDE